MNKFFYYRQNNSGGVFFGPQHVFVEAHNAIEANKIALDHGLYFNGVASGRDCECCGSRWHEAAGEGDSEPLVFGEEPDDAALVIRKG